MPGQAAGQEALANLPGAINLSFDSPPIDFVLTQFLNARNVEGFVSVFATDAALYNISENSPIVGYEAIRQAAEQMLASLISSYLLCK